MAAKRYELSDAQWEQIEEMIPRTDPWHWDFYIYKERYLVLFANYCLKHLSIRARMDTKVR